MSDEIVTVESRAALRDWLEAHHATSPGVWIASYKKHTTAYLPWGEAVEELLCWGWVDGQVAALDEDRMRHRCAPRNPRSAWSAVNKEIVARMRAEGRMAAAGEAVIALAVENGMWSFLDDVERLEVPEDLAAALGGHAPLWESWPRSVRRGTLEWIKTAKTPETRGKRIADVVESAGEGLRPSPFRR
ncbi:YdeI/OmpD-associated family protein [Roseibacterium sp. SDUM158016]|uniref:YdeI/OmpD-associated family protein n=1 Tax=Roseicyclus sediminis TaxID=2980997 RepID=UPI0021CE461E|nr:YdeI/OmpD-associated family protein [Roseibacterium sp. SDUM158016]MCU4653304.1 YdeI/OmpD-associated family protein [Roseibacterium sp. SDUM158016]